MRDRVTDFPLDAFSDFIEENDGQVLTPTNQWEVLRYKISRNTFVIYQNKRGELNLGPSARHLKAMKDGGRITKGKRQTLRDGLHIKRKLLERDGPACACCGQFMGNDRTLEHWLGVASGGSNSPANLSLMHDSCNVALGNRSVTEKFALCQNARSVVNERPPWELVGPEDLFKSTAECGVNLAREP